MPRPPEIPNDKFIAVIMRSATLADAARELGITRQAVSKRVRDWKKRGVKGLPDFDHGLDVGSVQKLVDKHKKGRK